MKNIIYFLPIMLLLASCGKDKNLGCSSNCTIIKGKFISLNNEPVRGMRVLFKHTTYVGPFSKDIVRYMGYAISDRSGEFYDSFYINDDELGYIRNGDFDFEVDDGNISSDKYITMSDTHYNLGFGVDAIYNRETVFEETYYLPKKAFIKIHLNNYEPIKTSDYFYVNTYFPWGRKTNNSNNILNSEFAITSISAWARQRNNTLYAIVAEGEKNIVEINRIKNGVKTSEEIPIFIPPNNTIELTYDY